MCFLFSVWSTIKIVFFSEISQNCFWFFEFFVVWKAENIGIQSFVLTPIGCYFGFILFKLSPWLHLKMLQNRFGYSHFCQHDNVDDIKAMLPVMINIAHEFGKAMLPVMINIAREFGQCGKCHEQTNTVGVWIMKAEIQIY